jgi:hypothetical protein
MILFANINSLEIAIIIIAPYLLLEVLFFLYVACILTPKLQPTKPGQASLFKDPAKMIYDIFTMLEKSEVYTFEKWCCGFCLESDFEDIYSLNFESAISWAIFTSTLENLNSEQRFIIEEVRKNAEKRFSVSFKPGYNESVKNANFNLEPVYYLHKPLILYAGINIVASYQNFRYLYGCGLNYYQLPCGANYWLVLYKF